MSQISRGACSALRISTISEASLGSWSRATLTSSSEFCTGMYTDAIASRYYQTLGFGFHITKISYRCCDVIKKFQFDLLYRCVMY